MPDTTPAPPADERWREAKALLALVTDGGERFPQTTAAIRLAVRRADALDAAVAALQRAKQFIRNGVECGYIRMPDTPYPALTTLPAVEAALAAAQAARET